MTVIEMAKREEEKLVKVFSIKESQIQRAIVDLLAAERVYAIRLNTGVGFNKAGVPISHHSGGKGVADVLAFLPSSTDSRLQRVLWIEVKRPGGKQTPEQLSFQDHVNGLGHYYLLAFDASEVLDWLTEYRRVS